VLFRRYVAAQYPNSFTVDFDGIKGRQPDWRIRPSGSLEARRHDNFAKNQSGDQPITWAAIREKRGKAWPLDSAHAVLRSYDRPGIQRRRPNFHAIELAPLFEPRTWRRRTP
jgi:hypothetical protein